MKRIHRAKVTWADWMQGPCRISWEHPPSGKAKPPGATCQSRVGVAQWKLLSRVQLFATPWTDHVILQARILEWVAFPSPGDLPNPGIESRSPALYVDSLPAEPQGRSKNTGVGSLSLLQQSFLTQESNWGLLHCRQVLYQLSYEGSCL